MTKLNLKIAALLCALTLTGFTSGCGDKTEGALSKEEKEQFRAPLGQPMPAEARAAMEKANKPPAANTPIK